MVVFHEELSITWWFKDNFDAKRKISGIVSCKVSLNSFESAISDQ